MWRYPLWCFHFVEWVESQEFAQFSCLQHQWNIQNLWPHNKRIACKHLCCAWHHHQVCSTFEWEHWMFWGLSEKFRTHAYFVWTFYNLKHEIFWPLVLWKVGFGCRFVASTYWWTCIDHPNISSVEKQTFHPPTKTHPIWNKHCLPYSSHPRSKYCLQLQTFHGAIAHVGLTWKTPTWTPSTHLNLPQFESINSKISVWPLSIIFLPNLTYLIWSFRKKKLPHWGVPTLFQKFPYSWLNHLLNILQLTFHHHHIVIAIHFNGLWKIQFSFLISFPNLLFYCIMSQI